MDAEELHANRDGLPAPSTGEVTASRGNRIAAIDIFCGIGGLSYGLASAGVDVVAGIDVDGSCKFPFEANVTGAQFIERDVCDLKGEELLDLWPEGAMRLLAGCAPCQPFSSYRKGVSPLNDHRWELLREFSRLVEETQPEFVTTENVPRIISKAVLSDFVAMLRDIGYSVDSDIRRCTDYGLAQNRRRLVLVASRLGPATVPEGNHRSHPPKTVRQAIGKLPTIEAGSAHATDPVHRSRGLSALNRKRIVASKPGGTWEDWPGELRAACHRRESGTAFKNVYARMRWDEPSPTITTYFHNFGAGRFGHPEQHRTISLREAAILQGFPDNYHFTPKGEVVSLATLGRHIGNAVPPPLGEAIGRSFLDTLTETVAS
ncbi:MAG: DNA cytosine methyltransferase [Acidimicrobiaceae bacterium]|nr:DNA cytosine methyltransferase [Acidimicrobiaceae bacterium]MXW61519.1 DNA cytosine methyltransferase [Acidimicrobiaceae bacterium]MYC42163.1 DNA cytosine methyltransferase [Acidimicrobiaceae bacterium]